MQREPDESLLSYLLMGDCADFFGLCHGLSLLVCRFLGTDRRGEFEKHTEIQGALLMCSSLHRYISLLIIGIVSMTHKTLALWHAQR